MFTWILIGNGFLSFYYHLPVGIDDENSQYLKTGLKKGVVARQQTELQIKKDVSYFVMHEVYSYVKKQDTGKGFLVLENS
ncbi:MAG: hypothetical protein ACOX45_09940 [Acutalibacteraceae bacterium]